MIWDFVIVCTYLLVFFYVPISIATDIMLDNLMNKNLKNSCVALLILDFLVSLNTGYYKKGILITDRRKIWEHVIKRNFFIDLLVLLSFTMSNYFPNSNVVLVLVFVKLRYFSKNLKKIRDSFNLTFETSNYIDLFKLLCTILFISHIMASVWVKKIIKISKNLIIFFLKKLALCR